MTPAFSTNTPSPLAPGAEMLIPPPVPVFVILSAGLLLAAVIASVFVNVFAVPSCGTTAVLMLKLVLPPSATDPPPVSPLPALTVTDELCSMGLVTPALAILNVPLVVIGPPVRPAPLPTLVTVPVPVPRLAQAHVVPLYCRI